LKTPWLEKLTLNISRFYANPFRRVFKVISIRKQQKSYIFEMSRKSIMTFLSLHRLPGFDGYV